MALLASCTTSRWVVKDQHAIDRSDYEVLEEHRFLTATDSLTPANPVLRLNILSHTTRRYKQKAFAQRSIQDYQLRPAFVLLGLAGGAAAFYAANTTSISGGGTPSLALNVVGILLSASGFLNLKPDGPPRALNEERYLRTTGSVTQTDTIDVREDVAEEADILVSYQGKTVFEDHPETIKNGVLNMSVAPHLNDLRLTGKGPGSFSIKVTFNDSTYTYRYPVASVLEPYAQITTEFSPLRSSTVIDPDNVLADLVKGSLIRIERFTDSQWYQVQYGNFQNYIDAEEARIVWRSRGTTENTQVVALPRVPFGNIDVEANIPTLRDKAWNAKALILTNQNYDPNRKDRRYAHRDGKLIASYLRAALGYLPYNIHRLTDIQDYTKLQRTLHNIRAVSDSNTEFFVYISGYGALHNGELQLVNISAEGDSSYTPLRAVFQELASMPLDKVFVAADIDFADLEPAKLTDPQVLMEQATAELTENTPAAILMGNRVGQAAGLYGAEGYNNRMHHIFPYFLARAWQQEKMDILKIFNYLKHNISYISRKLHDRPQNPVIYGDPSLSFIPEKKTEP